MMYGRSYFISRPVSIKVDWVLNLWPSREYREVHLAWDAHLNWFFFLYTSTLWRSPFTIRKTPWFNLDGRVQCGIKKRHTFSNRSTFEGRTCKESRCSSTNRRRGEAGWSMMVASGSRPIVIVQRCKVFAWVHSTVSCCYGMLKRGVKGYGSWISTLGKNQKRCFIFMLAIFNNRGQWYKEASSIIANVFLLYSLWTKVYKII